MNKKSIASNPDLADKAKECFRDWFALHPGVRNPTDVNTEEKYRYFVSRGWGHLELMQAARKQNTEKNGWPFEWTKPEYWDTEL